MSTQDCSTSNTSQPSECGAEDQNNSQTLHSNPEDSNSLHSTPINIDDEDDDIEIDTSKLTSTVWQHMKKKKIKGIVKAVCNYCGKLLSGATANGTRHLHDHINKCPKHRLVSLRQKVITTNFLKGDGKRKLEAYTFDQETARRELATMIILHEYPLSMVDHVGFRRFTTALQPVFKMVSRNTIKSDILKIYDYERQRTMTLIEKNSSRVAFTTDMWTASNQKKGYMAITAHLIDDSWRLQSRILRFVYVPCPHTKEVLCEVLLKCFWDWNVEGKISTITVDNCTTNDAMIDSLCDKLDTTSLLLGGDLLHMRCCAHILNLVVKDGLDVIREGIAKIRDSVHYWTATPKREETYMKTARNMSISTDKKMELDCPTRWNSTYLMLKSALIYKDVFNRLKTREPQFKICISESDWEFARDICEKLKLFYHVTELFSGTKFPTANLYFPKVCDIKMALNQWSTSSNVVIQEMSVNMLEKYNKYWYKIHGILGVAAVLDPRYKLTLLEYYFPILYGSAALVEIEKIRKCCYDLLSEYQERNSTTCSSTSFTQSCGVGGNFGGQDSLSDYDMYVSQKRRNRVVQMISELDLYLEEEVLPRDPDFDILGWWKSNGLKYPNIQAIARDILAIPVSTVASESAFSTSGRLVSPHRSRLHPKTLEALMCAQSWLWVKEMQNKDGSTMESNGYATIYDDIEEDDSCITNEIEVTNEMVE